MVMGHYATALIPYAYESNMKIAPFFCFFDTDTNSRLHHVSASVAGRRER